MHNTTNRRRSLSLFRARVMRAAGLAAMAAPLVYGTACTSTIVVEGEDDGGGGQGAGGQGGAPTTSSSSSSSSNSVVSSSSSGVGGAPATSSVGPSTSVSSSSSGVGGGGTVEETCYPTTPNGCPTLQEAPSQYGECTYESFNWIVEWLSGPYLEGDMCCYEVVTEGFCGVGRPLMVEDRAVTAARRTGSAWSRRPSSSEARLEGLSDEERALLAAAWTRDGLYEHASVASFARFALELMALGAPPELVAGAHQAALDEVAHAELCFSLASRFFGEAVGAGPLEGAKDLTVRADLVELAVATFYEGCVGETLAAIVAAEQRDRATDEDVRAALTTIAEDEARHAELAWQTVAWAIANGGEPVRRALADALLQAGRHTPETDGLEGDELVGWGRLPAREVAEIHRRAIVDVVMPCAQGLLARQSA